MLDKYMRKALRKGIPPLFVDLRPLYKSESKATIIEELCQGNFDLKFAYLQNTKVYFSQKILKNKGILPS